MARLAPCRTRSGTGRPFVSVPSQSREPILSDTAAKAELYRLFSDDPESFPRLDPTSYRGKLSPDDYARFQAILGTEDAAKATLEKIARTDPDRAEAIRKGMGEVSARHDDWHARWGYIESKLPQKLRDKILRKAARYPYMSRDGGRQSERNVFANWFRQYRDQDPYFHREVWNRIMNDGGNADHPILRNPRFNSDKDLEAIANVKVGTPTPDVKTPGGSKVLGVLLKGLGRLNIGLLILMTIQAVRANIELNRRREYRRSNW